MMFENQQERDAWVRCYFTALQSPNDYVSRWPERNADDFVKKLRERTLPVAAKDPYR